VKSVAKKKGKNIPVYWIDFFWSDEWDLEEENRDGGPVRVWFWMDPVSAVKWW